MGLTPVSDGALKSIYNICTFINIVAPWMLSTMEKGSAGKKGRGSCHLENICYSGENRVLRRNKWDLGYEWWLEWGDNTDEVVLHGRRKKASCFCSRVVDQTNES